MKVSVLGCGAYGIALSMMVNRNNHDITMWTKFEDEKKMLETKRENKNKLPNVKIPNNIKFTTNLEEAVKIAKQKSNSGDIVLLSPASASFDAFKNFEERGKKFKQLVNEL